MSTSFQKRNHRNLLRILWHHSSKSVMLLCSLCFSVVPPCSQKFCTRLLSFQIPMLMSSCLPKLVSQAQHLYLTVSKAVTVVSTVRKIFCLFLSVKARCKKALRYFPGTATVVAGWRLVLLPCSTKQCMWRAAFETSKTVSLRNCRSEKN